MMAYSSSDEEEDLLRSLFLSQFQSSFLFPPTHTDDLIRTSGVAERLERWENIRPYFHMLR